MHHHARRGTAVAVREATRQHGLHEQMRAARALKPPPRQLQPHRPEVDAQIERGGWRRRAFWLAMGSGEAAAGGGGQAAGQAAGLPEGEVGGEEVGGGASEGAETHAEAIARWSDLVRSQGRVRISASDEGLLRGRSVLVWAEAQAWAAAEIGEGRSRK